MVNGYFILKKSERLLCSIKGLLAVHFLITNQIFINYQDSSFNCKACRWKERKIEMERDT